MLKIGNNMITHCNLSAQEAVYQTTGVYLRGSSRGTIFVNVERPQKKMRIIKSTTKLWEMMVVILMSLKVDSMSTILLVHLVIHSTI